MLRLDWNLLYTIINLLFLYLLMKKFLFKPVSDIMEKRQHMIDESLSNAENSERKAEELKSELENEVKSVKEQSVQMLETARNSARAEYDRIVDEAGREAQTIVRDAHSRMNAEREQLLKGAENEIAELAMTAAEKILGEKSTVQTDSAMYDRFLAETGDADDAD